VEQGSFVRAAEMLSLSNAVVTRYIADLETHLGARLLNRSTRRLSLTEVGQAYLERVLHILPEIDEAEAIVAQETKRPAGPCRCIPLSVSARVSWDRSCLTIPRHFPTSCSM